MDFVPSPSLMSAQYGASPYSSIYEQDKPDVWAAIYRDPVSSEDLNILDDKLEDSTLQTLLTSDMMHSLQTSNLPGGLPSEFQWGGKPDPIISSVCSSGDNPTLSQLNMEPDMAIVEDILNMDSEENFLNSASNSPFNSLASVSSDLSSSHTTKSFLTTPAATSHSQSQPASKVPLANGTTKDRPKAEVLSSNFLRYNRDNFPPRGTQQPPVGVVTPVKKEEEPVYTTLTIKKEKEVSKSESKAPQLHKLLTTESVRKSNKDKMQSQTEGAAQIVPISSENHRDLDTIKSEPLSPEKSPAKRTLAKEESTEEMWKDIENYIYSPSPEPPSKKRRRNNSGSSAHMSDDEEDDDDRSLYGGKDYDDDSDDDYSDIDADLTRISPSECESLVNVGKKQKQFFWQYNVQSKGPKGTRLKLAVDELSDPHVLNDFEDPVFDESNTMVAGIRHGGKARKGDGNEITPNPKKLFMIGHQLLRLSRQINSFQLGPEVAPAKRNESKKEKNKLASRACRLKKKAQHEANKIKLFGLEREHSQLNQVLGFIMSSLRERAQVLMGQSGKTDIESEPLAQKLENKILDTLSDKIAGHSVDFVNNVILQVEAGNPNGGLNFKRSSKT